MKRNPLLYLQPYITFFFKNIFTVHRNVDNNSILKSREKSVQFMELILEILLTEFSTLYFTISLSYTEKMFCFTEIKKIFF